MRHSRLQSNSNNLSNPGVTEDAKRLILLLSERAGVCSKRGREEVEGCGRGVVERGRAWKVAWKVAPAG